MNRSRPFVLALCAAVVGGACANEVDVGAPIVRDPEAPLEPETPRVSGDPAACDPGSKTLHRLNRTEYDRTLKDLLGVTTTPADGFPKDDVGSGFDNNADVLSSSPLLVEKLDAAAQELAAVVFPDVSVAGAVARVEAEDVGSATGQRAGDLWNLTSAGEIAATVTTSAGRYNIQVRADQQAGGPDNAQMTVRVDGNVVVVADVAGANDYGGEVDLDAGSHVIVARFDNDFYDPDNGLDRNLLVDAFIVTGPLGVSNAGSLGRDRFVSCDVADVSACARASLNKLLTLAFRRPVVDDEVSPYVALVELAIGNGDSFDAGMRLATEALLLSPAFLYRAEFDDEEGAHRVSPYELASRLSYFFWATMPDEALFAKAADGSLAQRSVLKAEVERLLRDRKADGGVVNALATQWLNTQGLDHVQPDATLYPLTEAVRAAMKNETRLTVQEMLLADRSAKDLLDVEFTFVNADLAAFYGFANIDFSSDDDGDGFVKVSLAGTNRSGVLTHGAYLAANSYPFRTSPVKRGRWVVDQLLCMPPGEIPADVPPLDENESGGSVRERMEAHRANPSCAACHAMMDPIGFGLESFDPIGRSRSEDAAGFAIDDDDVFFDTAFTDPRGLAAALKQEQTLGPCISERLGNYGLGRGLDFLVSGDVCTIDDINARADRNGFALKEILLAIAEADAFQMRRPGTEEN